MPGNDEENVRCRQSQSKEQLQGLNKDFISMNKIISSNNQLNRSRTHQRQLYKVFTRFGDKKPVDESYTELKRRKQRKGMTDDDRRIAVRLSIISTLPTVVLLTY